MATLADRTEPLRSVIIDFGGVNFIDSQGASTMTEIVDAAQLRGTSLRLARVQPAVRQVLDAEGVISRLGAARLYSNLDEAISAEIADHVTPGPSSAPRTAGDDQHSEP